MHIIYSCTHTKIHTYMFIHSFILNIYIAPLQENYSEALPTPARSNKAVLRREKNAGEVVLLKMRSSEGRPFQVEGPTTESLIIIIIIIIIIFIIIIIYLFIYFYLFIFYFILFFYPRYQGSLRI